MGAVEGLASEGRPLPDQKQHGVEEGQVQLRPRATSEAGDLIRASDFPLMVPVKTGMCLAQLCSPSPHTMHWAAWRHQREEAEEPERSPATCV